jgi:hypothetical protein
MLPESRLYRCPDRLHADEAYGNTPQSIYHLCWRLPVVFIKSHVLLDLLQIGFFFQAAISRTKPEILLHVTR